MELPPSNNPLGGPVFPNGPIGNMFQPNDAQVKIPELGKKVEVRVVTGVPKVKSHPSFNTYHFKSIPYDQEGREWHSMQRDIDARIRDADGKYERAAQRNANKNAPTLEEFYKSLYKK